MSENLGNMSINLFLNIEPFKNQMQQVLNILKSLQSAKIGNPDASGYVQLKNAIEKTIPQVNMLEKEIKEETLAQKEAIAAKLQHATSVTKLSDIYQNIGLRVKDFQSIMVMLRSTFGDMLSEYNKQEIALAKLQQGLKNVGFESWWVIGREA
ncbi:MAG: hypothetical protein IT280_06160 [Ignavibacteria bacterium]|nr:hypothetical protein [Ignavibacteria bacterium]